MWLIREPASLGLVVNVVSTSNTSMLILHIFPTNVRCSSHSMPLQACHMADRSRCLTGHATSANSGKSGATWAIRARPALDVTRNVLSTRREKSVGLYLDGSQDSDATSQKWAQKRASWIFEMPCLWRTRQQHQAHRKTDLRCIKSALTLQAASASPTHNLHHLLDTGHRQVTRLNR